MERTRGCDQYFLRLLVPRPKRSRIAIPRCLGAVLRSLWVSFSLSLSLSRSRARSLSHALSLVRALSLCLSARETASKQMCLYLQTTYTNHKYRERTENTSTSLFFSRSVVWCVCVYADTPMQNKRWTWTCPSTNRSFKPPLQP